MKRATYRSCRETFLRWPRPAKLPRMWSWGHRWPFGRREKALFWVSPLVSPAALPWLRHGAAPPGTLRIRRGAGVGGKTCSFEAGLPPHGFMNSSWHNMLSQESGTNHLIWLCWKSGRLDDRPGEAHIRVLGLAELLTQTWAPSGASLVALWLLPTLYTLESF